MKQIRPKLVVPLVLVTVLTWFFRDPIRSGMALLVAGFVADSAVAAPQSRGSFNGFNVANATISTSEIFSGGPGRDGIPAIDQPRFIAASEVDYLLGSDLVISVSVGTEHRADPLRILVWHEIVNDEIGGRPIAVTYCPLCGTAMVFDRQVGERVVTFGVSGLLYQSDVLLYDRQTESLWSQLAMKAVAGPLLNTNLQWVSSDQMTWQAWWGRYGSGFVLSTNTGHARDYTQTPYRDYETNSKTMFPIARHRADLADKAWVLGLVVNGEAKAYPRAELEKLTISQTIRDVVGGNDIELSYRPDIQHAVVTNHTRGRSEPSVMAYWFAWQAFYPETEIWKP